MRLAIHICRCGAVAAPGGTSALLLAAAEYLPSYWLQLAAGTSAPKGEFINVRHSNFMICKPS